MLAIIAVLMCLSGMHARIFDRLLVRSELERFYGVCHYLQRSAMVTNEPVQLVCDTDRNTYRYRTAEYRLPAHVIFGCPAGVSGPPASPTNAISNPVTFKNSTITFHPDGVIQAGTVYFTDAAKRCAYALSCAVSQVSYLRKYQYTNTWVLL